ncbi:MAG TPA: glucose-6-phosphate isomerase, partial [Polyangiaceae bacterium]|nr:glucose-6-phosphate isomerase [Polyangiaceae bacterium]
VVGIGGSSLGPRFVARALGGPDDRLRPRFVDNTDPDGIDLDFAGLDLARTLVIVISKSGGTRETRNGMLEAQAKYRARSLEFAKHAVAVTGEGSALERQAQSERWLATFPMWDWVGGRTSELSAVGLLPAALQGFDVDAMLDGARACDAVTRMRPERPLDNPAMALALAWHHESEGRGAKDLVILPYKDRLALLSQYLQQLVMESLGKERDREGRVVHQGLAVYGNKGSTDQHAYVQQLRDGVANFFVEFVEVLRDRRGPSIEVEPGATSGDYLVGFLMGTRRALYEKGRRSLTIALDEVTPRSVGALIALHERAVGFYAAMVGINAYHQPGVEAGKRAAEAVIALQRRLLEALRARRGDRFTAPELADALDARDEAPTVFELLEHLAANPERGVEREPGPTPLEARYRLR